MDDGMTAERGPGADEATARLAMLDPALRREVKRTAMNSKTRLDDPVLAAAVVAEARRQLAVVPRLLWFAFALSVGVVVFIALSTEALSWPGLLLVAAAVMLSGAFQVLMHRWAARRAIERHLPILDQSGGQAPAPAPVHDAQLLERAKRNRRRSLLVGCALLSVMVLATLWISWQDRQVAELLRQRGEETSATVTNYDEGSGQAALFTGDRWDVEFVVGDETVRTRVISDDIEDGRDGQTIPVIYDSENPSVARHTDDLSGRAGIEWLGALIVAPVGLILAAQHWRDRRRYGGAGVMGPVGG